MKYDATTIAGMVAGFALGVASLPGLPKSVTSLAGFIAAGAVGLLGWHAKTCPPNSPGTDGLGNPIRPASKPPTPYQSHRVIVPLAFAVATLALASCACSRIATTKTQDPTTGVQVQETRLTALTFFDSGQLHR